MRAFQCLQPLLTKACLGLLLLSATACLRPLDSDFVNEGPGLEDNEMLWIMRIPNGQGALLEVKPTSDTLNFLNQQDAMFAEALPNLIEDVLNGSIASYVEYGDNKPAENLRERLQQFGGSKLNYAPLKRAVELFSIVKVDEPSYTRTPQFLSLVWEDGVSTQSGRAFVGVYVDSLPRTKYFVKTLRGRIALRDYLRTEWYHYEPVYVRTNSLEYTPKSHAEARHLRQKVKSGAFKSLEWEDGGLNISGKKRVKMEPEQVLPYAGSYVISQIDGTFQQEIFFSAQSDYLIADWEERFELNRIFPFHYNGFYSHSGDLYIFEKEEKEMRLYVITEDDTLYGQRFGN